MKAMLICTMLWSGYLNGERIGLFACQMNNNAETPCLLTRRGPHAWEDPALQMGVDCRGEPIEPLREASGLRD